MRGSLALPTTGTLSGLTLVQGSNTAFSGLATGQSGAGWPSATDLNLASLAGVFARNTTTGQWGKRDEADTTWIVVGVFSEGAKTFTPAGLAAVAASGAYADLTGKPTLGTAAAANTGTSGDTVPLCNAANTYGAPQTPGSQALTDAATVAIAITAQIWTLTTAAARTIGAPTGGTANTSYLLVITTGGFTPSWNVAFDWGAVGAPGSLTGICTFDIYYDGSKYRISTRSVGGV